MERERLVELIASQERRCVPQELVALCGNGGIFLAFLKKLQDDQKALSTSFFSIDLTTDEGRLKAIEQQGIYRGRMLVLESIYDLIMEGMEQNEHGTDNDRG